MFGRVEEEEERRASDLEKEGRREKMRSAPLYFVLGIIVL